MPGRLLSELVVDEIRDHIKANIAPALQAVNENFSDERALSFEVPRDYFIYPKAMGFRTPCVFVIADRIDFQKGTKQSNFLNAQMTVNVTVLIEDRDADAITRKAFRYQAALQSILDQVEKISDNGEAKFTLVVQAASFGALYSTADDPNSVSAVYRKEVGLEIDCFLYEK